MTTKAKPQFEPVEERVPMLLTPAEAARELRLSPRKLWELQNQGEIATVRIGRCVRYLPEDLRSWVEARRRKP